MFLDFSCCQANVFRDSPNLLWGLTKGIKNSETTVASVQVEKKCFMGDFLHLLWKPAAGLAESAMRQKRTEDG